VRQGHRDRANMCVHSHRCAALSVQINADSQALSVAVCWQCVAVCCSVLQCVAVCCSVLQCVAVCCSVLQCLYQRGLSGSVTRDTATHCNTLQHTSTHCNTLQHTAAHCNTLQHTATHCNTLQHTATHCNTACCCRPIRVDLSLVTQPASFSVSHCERQSLSLSQCILCVCHNLKTVYIYIVFHKVFSAYATVRLWHTQRIHCERLQQTATDCNRLWHTQRIHCERLQQTATDCNRLQQIVAYAENTL